MDQSFPILLVVGPTPKNKHERGQQASPAGRARACSSGWGLRLPVCSQHGKDLRDKHILTLKRILDTGSSIG